MVFLSIISIIFLTFLSFFFKVWKFQIPNLWFQLTTIFYIYICYELGENALWTVLFFCRFHKVDTIPHAEFGESLILNQMDFLILSNLSLCYFLIYCFQYRQLNFRLSIKDLGFWIPFVLGTLLLTDVETFMDPTKVLGELVNIFGVEGGVNLFHYYFFYNLYFTYFLSILLSFLFYFDSIWKENAIFIFLRLGLLIGFWYLFVYFLVGNISFYSFLIFPAIQKEWNLNTFDLQKKVFIRYGFSFSEASGAESGEDPCERFRVLKENACGFSNGIKRVRVQGPTPVRVTGTLIKLGSQGACAKAKEDFLKCLSTLQKKGFKKIY